MSKRRICDVAEEVLRETGNPGVMWGDSGLLDTIAERAGSKPRAPIRLRGGATIEDHPLSRWRRVLDALSRQPGNLVQRRSYAGSVGYVRSFWLPGDAP